jgi:ATP-dependent RNA helicase DDX19/DBP5
VINTTGVKLTLDPEASTRSLAHSMWSDEMKTDQKEKGIGEAGSTSLSEKKEKAAGTEDTNIIQNRYEVSVKLLDQQADPNSPLYSVKTFEELGL